MEVEVDPGWTKKTEHGIDRDGWNWSQRGCGGQKGHHAQFQQHHPHPRSALSQTQRLPTGHCIRVMFRNNLLGKALSFQLRKKVDNVICAVDLTLEVLLRLGCHDTRARLGKAAMLSMKSGYGCTKGRRNHSSDKQSKKSDMSDVSMQDRVTHIVQWQRPKPCFAIENMPVLRAPAFQQALWWGHMGRRGARWSRGDDTFVPQASQKKAKDIKRLGSHPARDGHKELQPRIKLLTHARIKLL